MCQLLELNSIAEPTSLKLRLINYRIKFLIRTKLFFISKKNKFVKLIRISSLNKSTEISNKLHNIKVGENVKEKLNQLAEEFEIYMISKLVIL